MTHLEQVHLAQQRTAALQDRLDQAQVVLEKAEKVAEAEEVAKSHAKQIIAVAAVVGVVAVAVLVIRRRRRKGDDDEV